MAYTVFLVDVQGIYVMCKQVYGAEARVDYYKMLDKAHGVAGDETLHPKAYMTEKLKSGILHPLAQPLLRQGYELRHYELPQSSAAASMIEDVVKEIEQGASHIIIASADWALRPAFDVIRKKGVRVTLMVFPGNLVKRLSADVDNVVIVNEDCLHVAHRFPSNKPEMPPKDAVMPTRVPVVMVDEAPIEYVEVIADGLKRNTNAEDAAE